jgi:hypothetical protein
MNMPPPELLIRPLFPEDDLNALTELLHAAYRSLALTIPAW